MKRRAGRRGEFDLIATYFAPLSRGEPGALNLTDDAAHLAPAPGHEFVVTMDAVVEGIHFLADDPPAAVAQKALRVNISDLAAKGARPRAYLLTAALSQRIDDAWLAAFAGALKREQKLFGLHLVGGDTVSMPGPLTFSITAIGEVAKGTMLRRAGAKIGDELWVSGTIGDAGLGLMARTKGLPTLPSKQLKHVLQRYLVPQPRLALGLSLKGIARACVDVSDGLMADVGHIADASRVAIQISAADVPLSEAAWSLVEAKAVSLESLLTAGDDYEIAFVAPRSARGRLLQISAASGTQLSQIGRVVRGTGVTAADEYRNVLQFARSGFTHS